MRLPTSRYLVFTALIFLISLMGSNTAYGQYWAQKAAGLTIEEGYDIAVDGSGNSITTGYFTGTCTFGGTSLTSAGGTDVFVTKTDGSGNFLWAVKAGGAGSDRGVSVALDNSGNIYIAGFFNGSATFGTTTLVSSGLQDVFVAKYSSLGTFLWAVKGGGSQSDLVNGIAVSPSGDAVITGSFKGTATFGTTSVTSYNTTSDVFTAKLNSSGVFQWVETGVGAYANSGIDVGIDFSGNVYVTGQFSDTITFGSTHNNAMLNAVFLIKYNSFGVEQWFKIMGGANANFAKAMNVTGAGIAYVTGEFSGTFTVYGTPNSVLNSTYTNNVFLIKFTTAGGVSWMKSNGSESDIHVEGISTSNLGKVAICGDFKCRLDEFADMANSGPYRSVGNEDIFVSEFTASGVAQVQRQIGGRGIDLAHGIAYDGNNMVVTGSFSNQLNIPGSPNFLASSVANLTTVNCNTATYCNDPNYGLFYQLPNSGNKDIFIANCFDPVRKPYDFFDRTGTGCNVDLIDACIGVGCPAVVTVCDETIQEAFSNMCEDVGPALTFSWSPGVFVLPTNPRLGKMINSGIYHVTVQDVDNCFAIEDSIEVVILSGPVTPLISDGKGYNNQTLVTLPVEACDPDTTLLSGHVQGSGNITYEWYGPGLPAVGVADSQAVVNQTGLYTFLNTDTNGCKDSNNVWVEFYPPFNVWGLKLVIEDTVEICFTQTAILNLVDTISNPSEAVMCLPDSNYTITTTWSISPTMTNSPVCQSFAYYEIDTTGWYTVNAMVVRENVCQTDTTYVTKTFYAIVNPSPVIPSYTITVTGGPYLCPGDSIALTATGAPNYLWYGYGVIGLTDSVIYVHQPGTYAVSSSVYDTNSYGCYASYFTGVSHTIVIKPQPQITAVTNVICPGDSVLLTCDQATGFFWEGPNGPIAGANTVYAQDPGDYFCVVNDQDSCGLVSNTINLQQYTTPSLIALGDSILCPGDTTQISVQSNGLTTLEWQAPLSGSSPVQTITSPGTYTCKITSCGIESYASITIYSPQVFATIIPQGVLCQGSTVELQALPGMAAYSWSPTGDTTLSTTISSSGTVILTVQDSNGCVGVSDPYLIEEIVVTPQINASNLGFCEGDSLTLTAAPSFYHFLWSPTGDTTPTTTVNSPGDVWVLATDTNGCTDSTHVTVYQQSVNTSITVNGPPLLCEGDSVEISASLLNLATYFWYPYGQTTPAISVNSSGAYAVQVTDTLGCLILSDTQVIAVEPNIFLPPVVSNDTVICQGEYVTLYAQVDTGNLAWYMDNLWVSSADSLTMQFMDSEVLWVQNQGTVCVSESVPIQITTVNCDEVNTSNIFTPNGDGLNDQWGIDIFGTTCFHLEIYNRWGQLIYTFEQISDTWDGTIYPSGEAAPDGVYYYLVNYCDFQKQQKTLKGYLQLSRK